MYNKPSSPETRIKLRAFYNIGCYLEHVVELELKLIKRHIKQTQRDYIQSTCLAGQASITGMR